MQSNRAINNLRPLSLQKSLASPCATCANSRGFPKHLSRINHGPHKGERGYDPDQHQEYWDSAWGSLTSAIHCPKCHKLQAPADACECGEKMKDLKSPTNGLNFHSLRHTFITAMVERGVPIGTIEAFVGHMSVRMIRHYTQITSGAARKAVEQLDAEPILPRTTALPLAMETVRTATIQ